MSKLFKMMGAAPQGMEPYVQTAQGLAVSLLVTVCLALLMMLCYRLCHDTLTYNQKFNVTLMMLSLSATLLLALIQNNPMFSLGALGALSICRIRTNTRDPRDLGFVFWALMIGISSALGAFTVGMIGTAVIGLIMVVFTKCEHHQKDVTIVVRGQKPQIPEVQKLFRTIEGSTIQSENIFPNSFEMVYTLDVPKEEKEKILMRLNSIDGIDGVNILAPETEVA